MIGFRPALWPTVMTVPALAALVALGTWQVERLHWKEALIASRASRLAAPPIVAGPFPADPREMEFRRVRLAGEFLHDAEMYLMPRSYRGQVGEHVITPLRLGDGSIVLVDRGWVPAARRDPATRAAGQSAGVVAVEGVARLPGRAGLFTPDNDPRRNRWYRIDVAEISAHIGFPSVQPWVVEAGPAPNPGGLPVGGRTSVALTNDHLHYAITWYGLAVALVVIYGVYHRRRPSLTTKETR